MPLRPDGECYIDLAPPEQLHGLSEFAGTADAIYQNLPRTAEYEYTFIVSGDHVFLMDGKQVYDFHRACAADLTIMAHEVSVDEARAFGVIVVDGEGRIVEFQEKPRHPKEIPGKPGRAYASMGIYFFSNSALREFVGNTDFRKRCMDKDPNDEFDFGKHVIPEMVRRGKKVMAYPFSENVVLDQPSGAPFWADVGTWGAYHEANMDLAGDNPRLNLYSRAWPIQGTMDNQPPGKTARPSTYDHAIIASGCIVDGATLSYSLLSPRVRVLQGAVVERSVIFHGAHIGMGARVRNCVIDEGVRIPDGMEIGYDPMEDQRRFHVDEESGLVIVSRTMEM
jgi:glucose-1-phosphate adenylyltransferase